MPKTGGGGFSQYDKKKKGLKNHLTGQSAKLIIWVIFISSGQGNFVKKN